MRLIDSKTISQVPIVVSFLRAMAERIENQYRLTQELRGREHFDLAKPALDELSLMVGFVLDIKRVDFEDKANVERFEALVMGEKNKAPLWPEIIEAIRRVTSECTPNRSVDTQMNLLRVLIGAKPVHLF